MNTRFDPQEANIRRPTSVDAPVVESATDARQGRKGSQVLMVLICGLVLAMIAWGGAEWWGQSTAPPAEQTAKPPAAPAAPNNTGAAPSTNPVIQQPAPTTNARPSGNP